jgi:aminotransferase
MDDVTFAEQLLKEERVAVVPGSTFGDSGRGFVRICYAAAYADLEVAMDRMEHFVTHHRTEAGGK